MESDRRELGVLFADVSDSSHLFSTYGDARARDILGECLDVMLRVVRAGPGSVVKCIGDEVFAVFPTPDSTAGAAAEIQVAMAEAREADRLPAFLAIRVGFHFGPVLVGGDEPFGETIYTAKRVSTLAKGNQIVTTGETVERFSAGLRQQARFREHRTLRGQQQMQDIYELPWDDPLRTTDDDTQTAEKDVAGQDATLDLVCGDVRMSLSAAWPVCTIGRSERCDLRVDGHDVSRIHARIEYRNDRFVVIDLSANGTVVGRDGAPTVRVRDEEHRLSGAGTIQVSKEQPVDIRYCLPRDTRQPGT